VSGKIIDACSLGVKVKEGQEMYWVGMDDIALEGTMAGNPIVEERELLHNLCPKK